MIGEAEFYYKRRYTLIRTNGNIYYNYGFLLSSRQRYEEALPVLNRYIELDPTGPLIPFTNRLLEDIVKRVMENKSAHLIRIAVIALSTFLAYSNSFNSAFHFDDYSSIITHPYIKSMNNIPYFFTITVHL